ncbi:MAG: glycosyltransferase family 2 protein [Austwickia sp.]|nr:MAG: glycosyltransferase family 2 protein [Austwickia sp.]
MTHAGSGCPRRSPVPPSESSVLTTRVLALIPAHNEQVIIGQAITALHEQSRPPERIVVVADNCTDDTVRIARDLGAEVFETVGNVHKKGGALNQALDALLPDLGEGDFVFVQDADSVVRRDFLHNAEAWFTRKPNLGALGGTFRALPFATDAGWQERLLWRLQDNEYARYQRDVERLNGKCLVVTGTAALFKAATLRHVQAERGRRLPMGGGGIYDTTVLTEDNEISFAIMHLGYDLLAPHDCLLETDAMQSWKDLYNQRLRWKRGAVENCVQYGLTLITLPYWGRQLLTMAGVIVTALYLASLVWSGTVGGGIHIHPFWIWVTGIFVVERFVTVSKKGVKEQVLAASMWEIPFEMFLSFVHADAYVKALTRQKKVW